MLFVGSTTSRNLIQSIKKSCAIDITFGSNIAENISVRAAPGTCAKIAFQDDDVNPLSFANATGPVAEKI